MILAWIHAHFVWVVTAGAIGAVAAYLFLQPFGKLVAGVIAVAVAALWLESYGAAQFAEGQKAGDAAAAAATAQLAALRSENEIDRQASEGYQRELQSLRDRPPVVAGPVRLCKPAVPARPAAVAPAGGSLAGAATAGLVPAGDGQDHREGEGPDIGADFDGFARRCEAVSGQLRGVLARVNAEAAAR